MAPPSKKATGFQSQRATGVRSDLFPLEGKKENSPVASPHSDLLSRGEKQEEMGHSLQTDAGGERTVQVDNG